MRDIRFTRTQTLILGLVILTHMALFLYLGYCRPYTIQEDQLRWLKTGIRLATSGSLEVHSSVFPYRISFGFAPGLPAVIAVLHLLSMGNTQMTILLVRLVQVGVSVVSCMLTMSLATKLNGRKAATAAGILYVFFPLIPWQAFLILKEIWGLLGINIIIVLLAKALQSRRLSYYVLAGTSAGITTLFIKQSEFLLVFIVGVFGGIILAENLWGFKSECLRRCTRIILPSGLAIMLSAQAIILAPWGIRNYLISSREHPSLTPVIIYPQERIPFERFAELLQKISKQLHTVIRQASKSSSLKSKRSVPSSPSHQQRPQGELSLPFFIPLEQNNLWDVLFQREATSLLEGLRRGELLNGAIVGKIFTYLIWYSILFFMVIGAITYITKPAAIPAIMTIIFFFIAILIDRRCLTRFLFPSIGCMIALAGAGLTGLLEAIKNAPPNSPSPEYICRNVGSLIQRNNLSRDKGKPI